MPSLYAEDEDADEEEAAEDADEEEEAEEAEESVAAEEDESVTLYCEPVESFWATAETVPTAPEERTFDSKEPA